MEHTFYYITQLFIIDYSSLLSSLVFLPSSYSPESLKYHTNKTMITVPTAHAGIALITTEHFSQKGPSSHINTRYMIANAKNLNIFKTFLGVAHHDTTDWPLTNP